MSTDTKTQDGEDRRIPATWEEFQRARREAFLACAGWIFSCGKLAIAGTRDEARRRYPITKRVPRVADLAGKVTARVVEGRVAFQAFDGGHYYAAPVHVLTPEDVKAVADLLARPYDEVAE